MTIVSLHLVILKEIISIKTYSPMHKKIAHIVISQFEFVF